MSSRHCHNSTSNILDKIMKRLIPLLALLFIISLFGCLEEPKPVSLGSSVSDRGLSMSKFKTEDAKVEVYLISNEAVDGELLAKALDARGKEIGRAKQTLNLGKDDAKLVTFTFDANVPQEDVLKFILDFRKL